MTRRTRATSIGLLVPALFADVQTSADEPPAETSAPWYEPTPAEKTPPPERAYVPIAIVVEPQIGVGALRGGTLTNVLANLPFGPQAGITMGIQAADTARFVTGIDLLRYSGVELALARAPGTAQLSVVIAPTIGLAGIFFGGVIAGDASIAPFGLRGVFPSAHTMIELRTSGHFLFGGQVDAPPVGVFGMAQTFGLQLALSPLFVRAAATNAPRTKETASR